MLLVVEGHHAARPNLHSYISRSMSSMQMVSWFNARAYYRMNFFLINSEEYVAKAYVLRAFDKVVAFKKVSHYIAYALHITKLE